MEQICARQTHNTVTPAPQTNVQMPQVNEPAPQAEPEVAECKCLKVTPDSKQYVGMIQGFDMRFEANNCEVIFLPTNTNEVKHAMEEIMNTPRYKEHFSIKGGGHCYENYVFNKDILAIVDVSLMDKVFEVDGSNGIVGAEAGGTNWSLIKELYRKYGVVIPGGSCYSVGLGGHICGGGYGLLSRKFGLTIDYLSGVDIVCVDSKNKVECKKLRKGSKLEEDQDLLWACKGGGGGNYGIITCYYFENPPVSPHYAYLVTISIDWIGLTLKKFQALLAIYWEIVSSDIPFFTILHIMHISAGEIPFLFQSVFSQGEKYYDYEYSKFITKLKNAGICLKESTIPLVGHPSSAGILNIAQELTWFEAAQTLNSSGGNQCGKYKSSYMRKPFPDHQSSVLYQYLTMTPSDLANLGKKFPDGSNPDYDQFINDLSTNDIINMKQSVVQVDSYGICINDVDTKATAIPQRDSRMKLQYQTYWKRSPPPLVDRTKPMDNYNKFQDWIHLLWINQMFKDVYSETGGVPDPYYTSPVTEDVSGATPLTSRSCVDPLPTLPPERIVDGCYYNYIDEEMVATIQNQYGVNRQEARNAVLRLYFENNLDRLVKAKKQSDPNNIFKHGLSIPTSLKPEDSCL